MCQITQAGGTDRHSRSRVTSGRWPNVDVLFAAPTVELKDAEA